MNHDPEINSTVFTCRADLVRISHEIARLYRYPEALEVASIVLPAVEQPRILIDLLFPKMRAEIALENLAAAGDWKRLGDVLDPPIPDLKALLTACEGRLAFCRPPDRAPWDQIRDNLVQARRRESAGSKGGRG